MVSMTINADTLQLNVQGFDRLWAFKSHLAIPLAHIEGVAVDATQTITWWKTIQMPGVYLPGVITAGTFYQDGKRVFWDVKNPEKTIIIALHADRYDQLIVEVADPVAAAVAINAAVEQQQP